MEGARARVIVVSAPFRLSLAGGGLDLPEWYERHGARLLAVTLAQRIRVEVDRCGQPASGDPLVELFRERVGSRPAVRIEAPISPGAGLGGSGALAVALVAAQRALGTGTGVVDAMDVAREAYTWEREVLGRPVGFQDQVAAALGGCTQMVGRPGGAIEGWRRDDLLGPLERLLSRSCLLVETEGRRDAAGPLSRLATALDRSGSSGAAGLADVDELEQLIVTEDGEWFGDVLRRHWRRKVELNPAAAAPGAATLLDLARRHGASGGKVVGAGGGGMVLLSGPASRRDEMRAACIAAGHRTTIPVVGREGVVVHDDLRATGRDAHVSVDAC